MLLLTGFFFNNKNIMFLMVSYNYKCAYYKIE